MLTGAIKRAFHAVGLEIRRSEWVDRDFPRLAHMLKSHGVSTVLDVGANVGQFARSLLDGGYDGRIISFEPIPEAHAALVSAAANFSSRWIVAPPVAISDRAGVAHFHVSLNLASSSLRAVLDASVRAAPESGVASQIEVRTERLDVLLQDLNVDSARAFLKIDTQGTEDDVLRGAGEALSELIGVKLEMSLQQLYDGQAPAYVLDGLLREQGFEAWGLEPGFRDRASGRLLQYDGVYFRAQRISPSSRA